jgi:hypothetical protein
VGDECLMDPRVYSTVVRGVLDYMRRDMTHPEGGLYSAEVGIGEVAVAPLCFVLDQLCVIGLPLHWLYV